MNTARRRQGTPFNRPDVDPWAAFAECAPDGLVDRAKQRARDARMPCRSVARAQLQAAVERLGFDEVRKLMTGDRTTGGSAGRTALYELCAGTRRNPGWKFGVALERHLAIRCIDWQGRNSENSTDSR